MFPPTTCNRNAVNKTELKNILGAIKNVLNWFKVLNFKISCIL